MNVEIETEAPIFLFREYFFQIFGVLSLQCGSKFATSTAGVVDTSGKFATSTAGVVDTGGKFATNVNDTGANLPPLSTTPTGG
jgi:hypothetical protein